MKIAFTGPAHVGKTAMTQHLVSYYHKRHFAYVNYTDAIKEVLAEVLAPLQQEPAVAVLADIHNNKELYRSSLRKLGYECGFDSGERIEPLLVENLGSDWAKQNIVFDNLRYDGQTVVARSLGFTVVELVREGVFYLPEEPRVDSKLIDLRYTLHEGQMHMDSVELLRLVESLHREMEENSVYAHRYSTLTKELSQHNVVYGSPIPLSGHRDDGAKPTKG